MVTKFACFVIVTSQRAREMQPISLRCCFVLLAFSCFTHSTSGTPATIDETKTKKTERTTVGTRVALKCHYNGYPKPQVIWLKNKKVLKACQSCVTKIDNKANKLSVLHVTPYREEDFGEYECKVRNQNGFASAKFILIEIPFEKSQCMKDIVLAQDPRLNLEYRPICDNDGLYHRVQCSIHLKKCWCVDRGTGHKTGEAYKEDNSYHCTKPFDLSSGSIVTLCIGIILLAVVADIAVFAFCSKGITYYLVRGLQQESIHQKMERHGQQEKGEAN